jgi:putative resolvase
VDKLIGLAQAAKRLGVTTQTLRAWDSKGLIKVVRTPGNQRRVPEGEILRLSNPEKYATASLPEENPVMEPENAYLATDSANQAFDPETDTLLMCRDIPVYNIASGKILNEKLLPGAMLKKTLSFDKWMQTRYSAGSNVTARRLMLRAFGTDNHGKILKTTRALSLSDCYWLKEIGENALFDDVTPYIHKEWDGTDRFKGGSIATLFANGAATKRWLDSKTLLKESSFYEHDAYKLCAALVPEHYVSKAHLSDKGLCLTNFTSRDCFFESFEQSGYIGELDDARTIAIELFKERAVALFVIDYLVESDDRHWGNIGFIRDANTGEYVSMAPYFDFDWIWADWPVALPDNASVYKDYIIHLCKKAKESAELFASSGRNQTIINRADELIAQYING